MMCYIWNLFVIPVFDTYIHRSSFVCTSVKNGWCKEELFNHRGQTITRAGSQCFPWPLTPTRQQHLMRHLIILKWLFPAGGAPCSTFYDQMSSTFAGQLLHQLHWEVKCFQQGLLWKKCANDVNFTLFTQRFMVFSGASMNCITHL